MKNNSKNYTLGEAADLLNVSEFYLNGLLDQGKIIFQTNGKARLIKYSDLHEYKNKFEIERRKAIAEMVSLSQEIEGDDFTFDNLDSNDERGE